MHNFFVAGLSGGVGDAVDLSPVQHQLTRVLRVQAGERIRLLDGAGRAFVVEIIAADRRSVSGRIAEITPAPAEPGVAVTLYQCALKADKLEWVMQKATELGVTTLVPLISERTVVRPASALERRRSRWESIVREAAEQCGRGRLPTIAAPADYATVLAGAPGLRLLAWEAATGQPGLIHALGRAELPVRAVSLLIGPEGGLSAAEVELAQAAGWQPVSLGPRVLRAETAALAALAITLAALGELGGLSAVRPA